MTLGYVGLGKMGKNMVLRLLEQGVEVVAWNRSPEPVEEVVMAGAVAASDLTDLTHRLPAPRIIWVMLPAGIMNEYVDKLLSHLAPGDCILDGTNSPYKETIVRAQKATTRQIHYVDIGVSGGPEGARHGACLMIGGETETVKALEPLFKLIASPEAYKHVGPSGAGHFTKMIHNGIEYGMMEAIAEGAAILQKAPFALKLADVFAIYNTRSVIESRLVGWTQTALAKNPELTGVSSAIGRLGEGDWTVDAAHELGVQIPVIEESLNVRKRSDTEPENFRNKVVTALRGQFGGHKIS